MIFENDVTESSSENKVLILMYRIKSRHNMWMNQKVICDRSHINQHKLH